MEYYYTPGKNVDAEKNNLVIDDFEFKHLTKVLRKRTGDSITVTDGERNIYHCKITSIDKDKLACDILSKEYDLYEPKARVTLYLSPLRNASRFEFAVEKAVELGVTAIKPLISEFTLNKVMLSSTKMERINKIIIGAMGQSQRCVLPSFQNAVTFNEMIGIEKEQKNKIVMYEMSEDTTELKFNGGTDVSLLIGPEGGFSKGEIDLLKKNNWQVRSLGSRKLRAETAAVVSVFDIISKLK
ncbi:MAG: RsmE family RNA methyltransferase [Ignavibacteria bacterium]